MFNSRSLYDAEGQVKVIVDLLVDNKWNGSRTFSSRATAIRVLIFLPTVGLTRTCARTFLIDKFQLSFLQWRLLSGKLFVSMIVPCLRLVMTHLYCSMKQLYLSVSFLKADSRSSPCIIIFA